MSDSLTAEIKKVFTERNGHTVMVTVGNTLRSDDGVGPYIAGRLRSNARLTVIDAQSTPENHIDRIVSLKPERIIFVDAADFGGEPGQIRLIESERIPEVSISTHAIPLSVIASILAEDTKAKIFFIGVQCKHVGLGESISSAVARSADRLIEEIKKDFY